MNVRISAAGIRSVRFSRNSFRFQQKHAEDGDRRGNPQLIAGHQRADHVRDQAGNFRGHPGVVVRLQFMPVGEPRNAPITPESERHGRSIACPTRERQCVGGQPDQRQSTHAAEALAPEGWPRRAVLFTLQANQKAQEKRQQNLHAFRRQDL